MILDEQGMFSNKQAITDSCASENILNLGKREVAFGTPVGLFIQVNEKFENVTSLTVAVQTDEEEDFSSAVTLIEQTIPAEELVKGTVSTIKFLPKGNLGFMRLYYTVAKSGEEAIKGTITAAIADSHEESFHNM